jgi:pimeloyl-ACP methyl ester carboxylesterase/predicted glycosyltransferase
MGEVAIASDPLHVGRTEQTRARYPDEVGEVSRDSVRIGYEVYGTGEPTVLLMPTWSIVHSRVWKMQIPYLARHCRVITFDGRGNGRSDRPAHTAAYDEIEFARDSLAVLDATATQRAVVVSFSLGAQRAVLLADGHPERVSKLVMIGPAWPTDDVDPGNPRIVSWDDELGTDEGWAKYNRHYWQRDYPGFLQFFFENVFTEPHSTKPIEDCVGWGLETTAETLIAAETAATLEPSRARQMASELRCPTLVIHGSGDEIIPVENGATLAEQAHGELVVMEGSGHAPHVRDPVTVNHLLRDFALPRTRERRWSRARVRRKRALFVSSPIGLGHAQRDVAIARELRAIHPDLEIDWLAQHPVTRVLEAAGERIHPASAWLASESAHIESESAEHDLHCFQAIRRMDDILLANFMVFDDITRDDDYDLWIGDEAWELDYYLHEKPELKSASYAWLTDFVGWLPMEDGGRESFLTADYNADMIEQIARFPRVRDRAIFVGEPDDIVPVSFGPDLPEIRAWTEEHYSFAGYVTGFDPTAFSDRDRLRDSLGYRDDEKVCVVTVGGSGVGADLLRRVIAAYPLAKQLVPDLRMVVVAGPRIDPSTLPAHDGLEVRAYVHELYRHLAACDMAVVQGGLTTAMELTANHRPFLYFPLRHHFEQNFHVRHRLERHQAGRCMDFATATPDVVATAIAAELCAQVDYLPVPTDGAARAANLIAELI